MLIGHIILLIDEGKLARVTWLALTQINPEGIGSDIVTAICRQVYENQGASSCNVPAQD
jgi:hypothetical protein